MVSLVGVVTPCVPYGAFAAAAGQRTACRCRLDSLTRVMGRRAWAYRRADTSALLWCGSVYLRCEWQQAARGACPHASQSKTRHPPARPPRSNQAPAAACAQPSAPAALPKAGSQKRATGASAVAGAPTWALSGRASAARRGAARPPREGQPEPPAPPDAPFTRRRHRRPPFGLRPPPPARGTCLPPGTRWSRPPGPCPSARARGAGTCESVVSCVSAWLRVLNSGTCAYSWRTRRGNLRASAVPRARESAGM